jgi:hypothetical protein
MIVGPGRAEEARRLLREVRSHVEDVVLVFPCKPEHDPSLAALGAEFSNRWEWAPQFCDAVTGEIRDFGGARNRSFALAACPWKMWLDTDDQLVGAERLPSFVEGAQKAFADDAMRGPREAFHLLVPYVTQTGTVLRERVVFDPKGAWKHAVHERFVSPDHARRVMTGAIEDPNLLHTLHCPREDRANGREGTDRNLRILRGELAKETLEAEEQAWARLELGRALLASGDPDLGIQELLRWEGMEVRDKAYEGLAAMLLSEAYGTLFRLEKAWAWAIMAMDRRPGTVEPLDRQVWLAFASIRRTTANGCGEVLSGFGYVIWKHVLDTVDKALAARDKSIVDPAFAGMLRTSFTKDAMLRLREKVVARIERIEEKERI